MSGFELKVTNLSVGYANKKTKQGVANGISFELRPGEVTVLLGENGAGKSTLLKTLSGVIPKLSGEVLLDKNLLESYPPNQLAKKIGMVLTDRLPENDLTVRELVELGRQPYTNWLDALTPADRQKVNWALEVCHVYNLQHKRCREISTGQMQHALIARALAQDTPFLILDEPTNHLDLKHKIQLFALLKNLAKNYHTCILLATHDLDLALQFADNAMVLKPGFFNFGTINEILERGTLERLFVNENIRFDPLQRRFLFQEEDTFRNKL